MPTPPLTREQFQVCWDALQEHGRPYLAHRALGMNAKTFDHRIAVGRRNGWHLSDGARGVIQSAKLAPSEARGGWLHSYDDNGKKIGATYWKAPEAEQEDFLERVRAAFEGMAPAEPVEPPDRVAEDLCNVFPLFDVHWGMHAWGQETGSDDYDLKHAAADLKRAFEAVLKLTPFAEEAVLIVGGDFYHTDDNTNQTPAHKHTLDADGRYQKIIDTSIEAMSYVIGRIQSRHRKTTIRVLRGNHDPHSHHVLRVGLTQRYRNDGSVFIDNSPRDLFMHEWGRAAIFAHHGDKIDAREFTLKLADVCPFWSSSPHRYAYTGHRHKMGAERIGGLYWERLEPFCPPDSYGASWANRRALKADTYHKVSGRVLTAIDPIERASLGA